MIQPNSKTTMKRRENQKTNLDWLLNRSRTNLNNRKLNQKEQLNFPKKNPKNHLWAIPSSKEKPWMRCPENCRLNSLSHDAWKEGRHWGGTVVPLSTGWSCHPTGRHFLVLRHGTTVPVSMGSPFQICRTSVRHRVITFVTLNSPLWYFFVLIINNPFIPSVEFLKIWKDVEWAKYILKEADLTLS